MTSVVLLLCGLLSVAPEPAAKAEDLAAYDAAKVKVGRDAEAHVKLALWCESHGLKAERVKHLALAVLADSKNALARGLMGLVAYQGKWDRPDQHAELLRRRDAGADLGRRAADRTWSTTTPCPTPAFPPSTPPPRWPRSDSGQTTAQPSTSAIAARRSPSRGATDSAR